MAGRVLGERRAATEIVAAPKAYGFDTGFVAQLRGGMPSQGELGQLWAHFVLDELPAHLGARAIRYWRDKRGHEVDFVAPLRGAIAAIECKWRAGSFEPRDLAAFRRRHPQGPNLVVAQDVREPWAERSRDLRVDFVSLRELIRRLRPRRP